MGNHVAHMGQKVEEKLRPQDKVYLRFLLGQSLTFSFSFVTFPYISLCNERFFVPETITVYILGHKLTLINIKFFYSINIMHFILTPIWSFMKCIPAYNSIVEQRQNKCRK